MARMETTGGMRNERGSGSGDRRPEPVPSDTLGAGATDAMGALGQFEPEAMVREFKEQTEA